MRGVLVDKINVVFLFENKIGCENLTYYLEFRLDFQLFLPRFFRFFGGFFSLHFRYVLFVFGKNIVDFIAAEFPGLVVVTIRHTERLFKLSLFFGGFALVISAPDRLIEQLFVKPGHKRSVAMRFADFIRRNRFLRNNRS